MFIPQRLSTIELPQFDILNDAAARWKAKGADVINLGQGVPGFPPPQRAIDVLRQSLTDRDTHVYSADAGIPALRTALAAALAKATGSVIDPEQEIIITAGGNQAFQLALTTLVDPGDEIILSSPYFLNHEMAVRSVGAIPIEAPQDPDRAFEPSLERLERHFTARTRAVVIVSPSNPTGAVIASAELARIVTHCAERGVIVIVDEAYLQFVYDRPTQSACALRSWRHNVVVVGSFSKSLGITGWRCGYLIAPAAVIAQALKIQDCMIICAPVPVQKAVAAVLRDEPDYTVQWLDEMRRRRDLLMARLSKAPRLVPVLPSGAFFMMVRVEGLTDSRQFARDLIERQQVVTIPGRFFGEAGEGYLRLSFGAAPLEQLEDACSRLALAASP